MRAQFFSSIAHELRTPLNSIIPILKLVIDIRQAANEVYDIMKFQLDAKKLNFKLSIHHSVPSIINSDQKRLKQVLFNLIGNAVKFTFSGEVSLTFDYENLTKMLTGSVRDTGVGIKQEDIDKLFRFFGMISSTKDINRGGMGLGLTISKLIIQ